MNAPTKPILSKEDLCLLADLWWLEYQDAAKDAREALLTGDNLKALTLAICAYKVKNQYEYYANRIIFG